MRKQGKDRKYKNHKEKNFVFAQMMKIDKMNREIDKKHRDLKLEIKNKDIELII